MKKLTALITALFMVASSVCASAAVHKDYTNETAVSGVIFTEGNDTASVSVSDGELLLNSSGVSEGNVQTTSSFLSPVLAVAEGDNIFAFTTKFKIDATENLTAHRKIYLAWGGDTTTINNVQKTTLINVKKDNLTVGPMTNTGNAIVDGEYHTISAVFNLDEKKITVYLDGTSIQENKSISLNNFDITTARIMFDNSFTPTQESQYSKFYIKSFIAATYNSATGPAITTIEDEVGVVNSQILENGFHINFGAGLISTPTVKLYKAYGTENEQEIEINTTFNGYLLNVKPQTGNFEDMVGYTIILDDIKYIGIAEIDNKLIQFSTIDANYQMPEIAITAPLANASFKVGETVPISATITPGTEEVVARDIYVNNQKVGTLSQNGTWSWTPQEAGNYTIKVVVTDTIGTTDEDSVDISVEVNEIPTVSFNVVDNAALSTSDTISVTAEDADGEVESIEVYLDGELKQTATTSPLTISLENLANGTHTLIVKAYDDFNAIGEKSVTFSISEITYTNVIPVETFNEETYSNKLQFYPKSATQSFTTVDAEHGKSVQIVYNGGDNPFADVIPRRDGLTQFVFECDVYQENAVMTASATGSGGSAGYRFFSYRQANQQGVDIEDNKWYHIKYTVDAVNSYQNILITGEDFSFEKTLAIAANFGTLSSMRLGFYINKSSINNFKIVIDNVKLDSVIEYPKVLSVMDTAGSTDVDHETSYIKVKMSGQIKEIKETDITLYNSNGEQKVTKVEIDTADPTILKVYPEGALVSGDDYKIKINKGVSTVLGNYKNDTIANFTTAPKPFDVDSGEIKKVGNNIVFDADFVNSSSGSQTAVMLLAIYKDGVFDRIVPQPFTSNGTNQPDPITENVGSGNYTAYGLVINDWSNMVPLSNKLFRLE